MTDVQRIAALANVAGYDREATRKYVDGAPHIKHASLRQLYGSLLLRAFERAPRSTNHPRVLDLGAGEGSVTLPFLELGAHVTAVDISPSQLAALRERCGRFGDHLVTRCEDVAAAVASSGAKYDIVVANSLLHHIPDYLSLLRSAVQLLGPGGQFFSFQDPMRFDSLSMATRKFSDVAHFSWRIFQGDVLGGMKRRWRRARGVYLSDCLNDNLEYHNVRNGVDQSAIRALFETEGFACDVISYFSTQSILFQPIGSALRMSNTFAVLAQRRA